MHKIYLAWKEEEAEERVPFRPPLRDWRREGDRDVSIVLSLPHALGRGGKRYLWRSDIFLPPMVVAPTAAAGAEEKKQLPLSPFSLSRISFSSFPLFFGLWEKNLSVGRTVRFCLLLPLPRSCFCTLRKKLCKKAFFCMLQFKL